MDRMWRLQRLIDRTLATQSTVGVYPELFLGQWQDPEVLFLGINPGTSGVHPQWATPQDALSYYASYFQRTALQSNEERNIWKMYKSFGGAGQPGAAWLCDSASCITNLFPWATKDQSGLSSFRQFLGLAEQAWPLVREFLEIAAPRRVVVHGKYAYDCLAIWAGLSLTYSAAITVAQPVMWLSDVDPLLRRTPVAVNRHLSRFSPSSAILQFVGA